MVGKPYLGITSELPVIHSVSCAMKTALPMGNQQSGTISGFPMRSTALS